MRRRRGGRERGRKEEGRTYEVCPLSGGGREGSGEQQSRCEEEEGYESRKKQEGTLTQEEHRAAHPANNLPNLSLNLNHHKTILKTPSASPSAASSPLSSPPFLCPPHVATIAPHEEDN